MREGNKKGIEEMIKRGIRMFIQVIKMTFLCDNY